MKWELLVHASNCEGGENTGTAQFLMRLDAIFAQGICIQTGFADVFEAKRDLI